MYPKILSDSTIVISRDQLKTANKLFTEGEMYKYLYKETSEQNKQYNKLITNYDKIDSLRINDINNLNKALEKSNNSNKTLSRINYILSGSVIGLVIVTLLSVFK